MPSVFTSQSNVKFSQILLAVESLNSHLFEQAEACNLHASTEVSYIAIKYLLSFSKMLDVLPRLITSPHLTSSHPSSSHLTSSHSNSPHLIPSHLTLAHLTSPHLTSPHFTLTHLTSSHLTLAHPTSSHITSSHLISTHLISPHLISSHLIPSHLISPHLTLSHLISHHLTSYHLIPPHPTSSHLSLPHLTSPHLTSSPHHIPPLLIQTLLGEDQYLFTRLCSLYDLFPRSNSLIGQVVGNCHAHGLPFSNISATSNHNSVSYFNLFTSIQLLYNQSLKTL